MDRRVFLKLTGLVVAASAVEALPVAAEQGPRAVLTESTADRQLASGPSVARLAVQEPGTYRVSGLVRLDEPLVEISGIANAQRISWSDFEGSESPVTSFMSFEHFDRPGMTPDIRVQGGRLEALTIVPVHFQ